MPENPIRRRPARIEDAAIHFNINPQWQFIDNDRIHNPEPVEHQERIIQAEEAIARIRNRQRGEIIGQVLDTVGIELESIALSRNDAARVISKTPDGLGNNFKVHRDGSSEINAYYVNLNGNRNQGINVNAHTKEAIGLFDGKYAKNVLGYELISVPMYIDVAEMSLWALLPLLENEGDFVSERCATHIHVGGTNNLGFLKNSLKLGLWFDEVFYSLAHMDGEKFRGYSNNAIYARPLQNGPYFKYDRSYYQILNWENALEASDMYEFFSCYGANVNREIQKYHPGRYFSINLYSVPRIGTVEFRHFNQSFNPAIIASTTKLCQLFVEVAMKARNKELKKLEPGNVFKLESPSYYLNKLYSFLELAESLDCNYSLAKEDVFNLERVIYNYKGIGIENKEILTHCKDFEISEGSIELGGLKKAKSKPEPDGHVDIHNIKYQSIIK